jgi:hypothetical protein
MYQFSRAIYRELVSYLSPSPPGATRLLASPGSTGRGHSVTGNGAATATAATSGQEHLLRSCEAAIERLATDRYYFARPARTLFCDIRGYFPMNAQERVYQVVTRYIGLAQQYLQENPMAAYTAVSGKPLRCRATTRKGSACQRTPLPHNGYCPSHQHLAETEDGERLAA